MEAALSVGMALDLSLDDVDMETEADGAGDPWFERLVAINQRWLISYARVNPSFSASAALLERNSVWMNTFFQRQRMVTSPLAKQAKTLVARHQQAVLARLRASGRAAHTDSELSTTPVEPMAALMFAASADRCPEYQIEPLLTEALDLLQCEAVRAHANRAGFASCVYRYLTAYTEATKRHLCLELLVLLADEDAASVVRACKVAAHGQLWQPNMFIYTLQKRHHDNAVILALVTRLLGHFKTEMPITSPVQLDDRGTFTPAADAYDSPRGRHDNDDGMEESKHTRRSEKSPTRQRHARSKTSSPIRTQMLPALRPLSPTSPGKTSLSTPSMHHRPTTTISSHYVGAPSPYSATVCLPIARPPTCPVEQHRRSVIFSTPKEKAIAGGHKMRLSFTPNATERQSNRSSNRDDHAWLDDRADDNSGGLGHGANPASRSALRSPELSMKKPSVVISEKYSWDPESINSVSGFEWWWRSLPPHHSNLDPAQKLKMVTKAAVRLHTNGDWARAVELYLLALAMDITEEVEFRLRVNVACAYEVGEVFAAAVEQLRIATRLHPEDAYVHFKLGAMLLCVRALDDAERELELALPMYPDAQATLAQVLEAKEQRRQQEEADVKALAAARVARSPLKTAARPLYPRTYTISSKSPRGEKHTVGATKQTNPERDAVDYGGNSSPQPATGLVDLAECIVRRSADFHFDLRGALSVIDSQATGLIRRSALCQLLSDLCGFRVTSLRGLLGDEEDDDDADVVQYILVLNAIDAKANSMEGEGKERQLIRLQDRVESLQVQEATFYATETTDDPSSPIPAESGGDDATAMKDLLPAVNTNNVDEKLDQAVVKSLGATDSKLEGEAVATTVPTADEADTENEASAFEDSIQVSPSVSHPLVGTTNENHGDPFGVEALASDTHEDDSRIDATDKVQAESMERLKPRALAEESPPSPAAKETGTDTFHPQVLYPPVDVVPAADVATDQQETSDEFPSNTDGDQATHELAPHADMFVAARHIALSYVNHATEGVVASRRQSLQDAVPVEVDTHHTISNSSPGSASSPLANSQTEASSSRITSDEAVTTERDSPSQLSASASARALACHIYEDAVANVILQHHRQPHRSATLDLITVQTLAQRYAETHTVVPAMLLPR